MTNRFDKEEFDKVSLRILDRLTEAEVTFILRGFSTKTRQTLIVGPALFTLKLRDQDRHQEAEEIYHEIVADIKEKIKTEKSNET